MALFKRGKWWWTDFTVNGARYRQSLETTDWREAQAREKEKIAQASAGVLSAANQQFSRLSFAVAADRYLEDQEHHLSPRSVVTARERLKPLKHFFGATLLKRVTAESILQYITQRKRIGLSNRTVNMEVAWIARLLKRAKRWHLLAEEIKPLPERHDLGRALKPEEKSRLTEVAKRKPEWQLAPSLRCLR